jgi:hypothetical protein
MSKELIDMSMPTENEAAAALQELAAGRQAVNTEQRRRLPVLLGAWSALVFLDYAAKDAVPDRRARRLVTGVCWTAAVGIGLLDSRTNPIQPVSVDPNETGPKAAAPMAGALLGWAIAERLIVAALRRSRLTRPNTAAGLVLAVGRPLGYLGVLRLTPKPHDHG